MSLCLQIGCTLAELGQRMSSPEFALWCGYRAMRPWGHEMAEFAAGTVAATVANYAGKSRNKDAPPAAPADFMPFLAREKSATETEPSVVQVFGGQFNTRPRDG